MTEITVTPIELELTISTVEIDLEVNSTVIEVEEGSHNNFNNYETGVTSINEMTGDVTLTKTDLGLGAIELVDGVFVIELIPIIPLDRIPDLASVAITNDYRDLDHLPDIPPDLSTDITGLSLDVTNINNWLADLQVSIVSTQTSLSTSVNSLQTQINSNISSINTNTNAIAANTLNINNNTSAIANNTTNINTNTTNIFSNTSSINTLNSVAVKNNQSNSFNDYAVSRASVTIITDNNTARTLSNSDNGSLIRFTSNSAVTVTVPSGLATGFNIAIAQRGTGQITITGSGTTIDNASGHTKTRTQKSQICLVQDSSNVYLLSGDTSS